MMTTLEVLLCYQSPRLYHSTDSVARVKCACWGVVEPRISVSATANIHCTGQQEFNHRIARDNQRHLL